MSTERPDDGRPVDDAVDQAWQAASTEGPPPQIDAAILAAARAEAERVTGLPAVRTEAHRPWPTKRAWWTAWQPLAAAAAVAGLAFVLVQMMPRDRAVEPMLEMEPSTREPAAAESSAVEDPAIPQYESRDAAEAPAPSAAVPPPSGETPASARDGAAASAPAGSSEATRAEPSAEARAPAAAPGRAATPAPAGVAAQADAELAESRRATEVATYPPPPADWAARIVELFESGDRVSAAEELRAFRASYADADRHLPEALRDWATTVK